MLKATGIQKAYGDLSILKGVDITVASGEVISIVGSSGAGTLSSKGLADFRNKSIGFIFQFHQLLPEFTALENAMLPALIGGKSKKEAEERAQHLFQKLNIGHRTTHKPSELSGGEQQRVAVCRSLMNQPAVIFADEPSGNLDTKNAQELHELFFQLREEFKQTFVIVTHNESFAQMADRSLVMRDGNFI